VIDAFRPRGYAIVITGRADYAGAECTLRAGNLTVMLEVNQIGKMLDLAYHAGR